jgi:cytochrome P450
MSRSEEVATAAVVEISAYLGDLVGRQPSPYVQALLETGELSTTEIVSNLQLLLIAGYETTVARIGNFTVTLFRNPDQLKLLLQSPELLPTAIDELLRYSRVIGAGLPRMAVADVELGSTVVREGELVVPVMAVANYDPSVFPDPHRLDITRTSPAPHLAFGHGPHYCLGSQLGRMELRIAIGTLLRRFPTLAPAVPLEELQWKTGLLTRGLHSLPVTW